MIGNTALPAFAVGATGELIAWNAAAEQLFGYPAPSVLGRPCHDVLCGLDLHGNRYCDADCPIMRMARRGEEPNRFTLLARGRSGETLDVSMSVLPVEDPRAGGLALVHVVHRTQPGAGPDAVLTSREREVLLLLAEGVGTRQIAGAMGVSESTVRTHVRNILAKLDVHSRMQAVAAARRLRLL